MTLNNSKISFNPSYAYAASLPTFKLRGSAGNNRTAVLSLGDLQADIQDYNNLINNGGEGAGGQMDLSGGRVDLLVDEMYVGRSFADSTALANGGSGMSGYAGFIFEQGTVNVNKLNIAYKQGTNASSCGNPNLMPAAPCFVTVRSNAVLTVNTNLTIAYRNGGQRDAVTAANVPYGQLNVNDSAVVNVRGNITGYTNSTSWIQLAGGTVNMTGGGSVSVSKLTGVGTIAGAGTVMVYSNLAPGGDFSAGTLNIGGNLIYSNSPGMGLIANPAITFNLGATNIPGFGINDLINVTGDVWLNNNPVTLAFAGPPLAGSNYTVVTYSGALHGQFVLATNQPPGVFGFDYSQPGKIMLHVNSPPTVNNAAYARNAGVYQLNIPITNLLSHASDSDGGTLTLSAVGVSTNGITPTIIGNYVVYYNVNNVADQFSYTVSDGQGGTASANVVVNLNTTSLFGQSGPGINTTGGAPTLTFAGIPGYRYSIQRATDAGFTQNVATVLTTNAPPNGVFHFTDATAPSPQAFYRLQWNP
jgi:hypothetical protein